MGFGPAERRSALHPPWKFLLKKQEFTVLQCRARTPARQLFSPVAPKGRGPAKQSLMSLRVTPKHENCAERSAYRNRVPICRRIFGAGPRSLSQIVDEMEAGIRGENHVHLGETRLADRRLPGESVGFDLKFNQVGQVPPAFLPVAERM
jgi:hypothetical protein